MRRKTSEIDGERTREHGRPMPIVKTDEVRAAREVNMAIAELQGSLKTPQASAAFRHILVATDFSKPSRRALCDALVMASDNNAQLTLIHVLQPDRKYWGVGKSSWN